MYEKEKEMNKVKKHEANLNQKRVKQGKENSGIFEKRETSSTPGEYSMVCLVRM